MHVVQRTKTIWNQTSYLFAACHKHAPLCAERRWDRPASWDTGTIMSVKYCGACPYRETNWRDIL